MSEVKRGGKLSFKDQLRQNDKSLQHYAALTGKPVPAEWLNNVPDAKPRAPRQASTEPTEHEHQKNLIHWWGLQSKAWGYSRLSLFAIPNSQALVQYATNPAAYINYLRVEGFRDGIPDLMLAIPSGDYHGAFLELKRVGKSVVSDEQHAYQALMTANGYYACIAYGFEDAQSHITRYLNKNWTRT